MIHIIPANAPIGVTFAPKLDPIITEYVDEIVKASGVPLINGTKDSDIGILFKKFAEIVESIPYTNIYNF